VLLLAQAHYCGVAWSAADSGFGSLEEDVEGPFLLLDADGRPAADATHAAVFVESQGHGILSATDPDADVAVGADGGVAFTTHGIVLVPSLDGAATGEPPHHATRWPYRLESTARKIWPGVADGSLLGEDGLLDGTCTLESAGASYPVPRYYEGDRFSGPFGADRGISPFAIDFGFSCGTVGALYFDPAGRYAECLRVPTPWSQTYVARPF
jgi:hypothetical protein